MRFECMRTVFSEITSSSAMRTAAHDVLHDLGFSCAQAELLADAGRLLGDAVLINRLAVVRLRQQDGGHLGHALRSRRVVLERAGGRPGSDSFRLAVLAVVAVRKPGGRDAARPLVRSSPSECGRVRRPRHERTYDEKLPCVRRTACTDVWRDGDGFLPACCSRVAVDALPLMRGRGISVASAAIASALVFAGIFVMRFAFYMMHMTYGISL